MQWILPQTDAVAELAAGLSDKYQLHTETTESEHLLIVDDFANDIIRCGALLVRHGDRYHFYGNDDHVLEFESKKHIHFVSELPAGELRQILNGLISVRKLETVQEFDLQRQYLTLRNLDDKAVLKLECLKTLHHQILLLKPIRGYDKALRQTQKQLQAMSARMGEGSLPHLLLELSDYQPTDYRLQPDVQLHDAILAREAVADIALKTLEIARRNEPGIIHTCEDTEYLHDYRVCLRKIRSLVSLLKGVFPEPVYLDLKRHLSDLAGKTNQLRDLDVYLLKQDEYQQRLPENLRDGLPAMFADFTRQQKKARRAVKTWLQSESYAREMEAVKAIFSGLNSLQETEISHQPLKALVKKKSRKCFKQIGETGSAITPETEDEEVHELRKKCKKFRYLLDFFGPLLQHEQLPEMTARLRKLQNTLGKFNDYSVQQQSLMDYLQSGNRGDELAKSIGALILILSQAQHAQREKVELRFADFYAPETQALAEALFQ